MKNFTIEEVLIYNPTLISKKKKPIESDIQQAKILAFYPTKSIIQHRCNSVGMAEGVYDFCNSLLPQQHRQKAVQTIFMDNCCLVQKQVEQNIWIFIKIEFQTEKRFMHLYDKIQQQDQQDQDYKGYISNSISQQILQEFISHFYFSFKTFYGKISAFLFLQKLFELQKILDYFVVKYQEINGQISSNKKYQLNASCYILKNIRAIPLQVNTTLKFEYFNNVMKNYDPSVMDMMIFANGFLAFTSLDKRNTELYARYLFGTNQPFRFDGQKIAQKFKILPQIPVLGNIQNYGSIFNSIMFGFDQECINSPLKQSRSSIRASYVIKKQRNEQDLLGMDQKQKVQFIDAYLNIQGQEVKYKLNFFIERNMVFLTFYKDVSALNQIIFANRFFHDNAHKFSQKISQVMTTLLNQNDGYRFLFANRSTCVGKCTFKDWNVIGSQIAYTLSRIKKSTQGQVATTFQNYWVYGIKRMNRVLILLVPNQVPLHKLQDFTAKMTREYFFKSFM